MEVFFFKWKYIMLYNGSKIWKTPGGILWCILDSAQVSKMAKSKPQIGKQ